MAISKDEKREIEKQRKKEILTTAKTLFFSQGFKNTSMSHIAEKAGMSKGLIYHYFKNKDELLLSFYDEGMKYLQELKKTSDPYKALFEFGVNFLVNDEESYPSAPPVQILLITFANREVDVSKYEKINPILVNFGKEYLDSFFEEGMKKGEFKEGNAETYGDIYWSFLLGKLLPMKKGREKERPEVYVKEILDSFRKE